MAFRGTDVKSPLDANYFCWHIDWAQFNWSQQTAKPGVTWEFKKPVSGQYAFRNFPGQEDPSSNGKLNCQELMVHTNVSIQEEPVKQYILFKMHYDKFLLSWKDFATNAPNTFRNLWTDQNFTDVTLATEDDQKSTQGDSQFM